jgi:hypothetical protein
MISRGEYNTAVSPKGIEMSGNQHTPVSVLKVGGIFVHKGDGGNS